MAVDPAAGGEEAAPAPAAKGARRKKKAEESSGGPERTLAGLLTEQLVAAAANQAGKPPRWVSLGLGAFMASQLEPGSPYYRQAPRRDRRERPDRLAAQGQRGPRRRGQGRDHPRRRLLALRVDGRQLARRPTLANFVHVMLEGQGKLDDAIGNCLNLNREEFLDNSGLWFSRTLRATLMDRRPTEPAAEPPTPTATSSRPGAGRIAASSPASRSGRRPATA